MMKEQTLEKMEAMKLRGMAAAFRRHVDQMPRPDLDPEELAAQMVDAEHQHRESVKLTSRLRTARFKEQATSEQIDWKHPRGVSKTELLNVLSGGWLQHHHNVIITGPTGLGKTYLACAVGHKLCRDGNTVLFRRASNFFEELTQARGDGTHGNMLRRIQRTSLLILDDFALEPLDANARHDLLEVMEDRYSSASTLITSQFDVDHWHTMVGDPTHADSILDRLTHNAVRVKLKGESIRKTRGKTLTAPRAPEE